MCSNFWLVVYEVMSPTVRWVWSETQCLSPGRTCSTLWAISFCACWRAALAALSCCRSLSLDSLSSVSSSSTLPSNCGNKRFVTCQTCLMTWEPGDTPGLTCCAGWYLRQDYSETGMTIRWWGWVRHGPVTQCWAVCGERKTDVFPGK